MIPETPTLKPESRNQIQVASRYGDEVAGPSHLEVAKQVAAREVVVLLNGPDILSRGIVLHYDE